ncbi:hypothetical protein J6500_13855 [Bradyrhizobium sp. WSM 1704]|uniref:hypothetical protein n=1 Tax=Bradyrhizobium semiaridum TaxID=2821404 RepID=UPI001CE322E4|nr:hypothetical protein [Bradyrhizobium semiaridum]MCA6122973.1 hypothetical protein [Bradyrhizobium semiaridum]
MDWKQERDLLIAQTMAFVQSVTGKRPDDLLTAAPPNPVPAKPAAPQPAPLNAVLHTPASVIARAAVPQVAAEREVAVQTPKLVPTAIEVPPPAPPAPLAAATIVEVPTPEQLPHFVKLDIRGDFQSEVRARVANFRANQQRFLKEREEYCSSTMAKVRAAIRDNSELPRSGK